jgi:hypothetical protein
VPNRRRESEAAVWVVKWRGVEGSGRAHDARFEGRRYANRDDAERVCRTFQANDRTRIYWVEEVSE